MANIGTWQYGFNAQGCPQWTRYFASGEVACAAWQVRDTTWRWEAFRIEPDVVNGSKCKYIDDGVAKDVDTAKSKCLEALATAEVTLDRERVRAHPIYQSAVGFIRSLIPKLEWAPFWSWQKQNGLIFRPTNCPIAPRHADEQIGFVYMGSVSSDKERAKTVLFAAGIGEAMMHTRKALFVEGLLAPNPDNPSIPKLDDVCAFNDLITEDCLADGEAARVVETLKARADTPRAVPAIRAHNRDLAFNKIEPHVRDMLRDGITPDEIHEWVRDLRKHMRQ